MLALDHIVFAGKVIEEASAAYSEKYALKTIRGGEHTNWGTYNYLAHFSNNCYIEWLGVYDMEKAQQSDNPLINHLVYVLEQNMLGQFQIALRTNKLEEYINHFNKNDIPFIGPVQGRRTKPDGEELTWSMLFPTYDHTKEMLPFLIEWDQPEEERMDVSLMNSPSITTIRYGGVPMERFLHLYNLPFKKRIINKLSLQNCKIIFTDDKQLQIELE